MPSYTEENKSLNKNLWQLGWSARAHVEGVRWEELAIDVTISSGEWIRTERLKELRARAENIALVESPVISWSHVIFSEQRWTWLTWEITGDWSAHWTVAIKCPPYCERLPWFEEFPSTQMFRESHHQQRRERAQPLPDRYLPHALRRIWFSDGKCFTVSNPSLLKMTQSMRPLQVLRMKREVTPVRSLREQPHFMKKVMVSV